MGRLGKGIDAISFDGDGTLWDFDKVCREGLEKVLQELRRKVDKPEISSLTVQDLQKLRDEIAAREAGPPDHEKVRMESFSVMLAKNGAFDKQLAIRLTEIYFQHRFGAIELFDETMGVLTDLQGHYKIGLTTNGNTRPARFGIRFDFTVTAAKVGVEKPHPRIFLAMLRQARTSAHETLHIGDSLSNDVYGAQHVGMPGIWLNRAGAINDTGVTPDAVVSNLREFSELL